MPTEMSYEITFFSVWPASKVYVNNVEVPYKFSSVLGENSWNYDGSSLAVVVSLGEKYNRLNSLQVSMTMDHPFSSILTSGIQRLMNRADIVKVLFDQQWGTGVYQEDYPHVVQSSTKGKKIYE